MAMTETMISAFTTLLVTVDPPGLAPLFLGLTQGMTREQRQQVAIRGSVMGFAILTVFALFGASILSALGISMGAFRIAGGVMLFVIAFEMTILFGVLATVIGTLWNMRVPSLKTDVVYDPNFSAGRFGVYVTAAADRLPAARKILEANGPSNLQDDPDGRSHG